MSDREFTRAAVLRRVTAGEITIKEATPLLGVSYRQAKRLAARFRAGGRKALVHGNTGRRSNRSTPATYREEVLELVRQHYGGSVRRGPGQRLGPTLAAEHLWTDHGVVVPVTTLTRWMQAAELWGRVRRARSRHQRRERNEGDRPPQGFIAAATVNRARIYCRTRRRVETLTVRRPRENA